MRGVRSLDHHREIHFGRSVSIAHHPQKRFDQACSLISRKTIHPVLQGSKSALDYSLIRNPLALEGRKQKHDSILNALCIFYC